MVSNQLIMQSMFARQNGSENGFFIDLRALENCQSPDFADARVVNYTYATPYPNPNQQCAYRQVRLAQNGHIFSRGSLFVYLRMHR